MGEMSKAYVLVIEYQHPYGKDVIGVFVSRPLADQMCEQQSASLHTTHMQYSVEEVTFFS
jgi:hypothetical protein